MLVADVSESALAERLSCKGIGLDFGAVRARVRTDVADMAVMIHRMYGRHPLLDPSGFFDVTAVLRRAGGARRLLRRQIEFISDGRPLFFPFPADTHLPLFEWGLNFLFAERVHFHLMLHSGAVEFDGCGILLPALPGSGKSTLTAALSLRGSRLLSDEFGVLRLSDGMLLPLLKLVGLKNESIDVIADFSPGANIGPAFRKTRKGTVAHLAPDARAVDAIHRPVAPMLVIFPKYDPHTELLVEPVQRSRALGRLAVNSFNAEVLGPQGFLALGRLVQSCDCYQVVYRNLDRAVETIKRLATEAAEARRAQRPAG
jgi:HprK-related kinase A